MNDLLKRLRGWARDIREGSTATWAMDQDLKEAADRIEELEVKLAKSFGALADIDDGEPEWPDDPQKELDWCRNRARTTLAELKGTQP